MQEVRAAYRNAAVAPHSAKCCPITSVAYISLIRPHGSRKKLIVLRGIMQPRVFRTVMASHKSAHNKDKMGSAC